jgi:hypothetical protein
MTPGHQQTMLVGSGIAATVRQRAKCEADCSWEAEVAALELGFESDTFEDSRKWETDEDTEETGDIDESADESARLLQVADGLSEASDDSDGWFSDSQASSASCRSEHSSGLESMDSMVEHFDRDQTIIIFDWDDTLCPTTVLNEEVSRLASLEDSSSEDPPPTEDALQDLVVELRQVLERARELAAEVIIVTNATEGWVESSCETWLPGFRSTIDCVQIKSARSTWEPLGVTTPTGWKAAEFEEVISQFYSRYWRQSWKNVIVIGDACYEHEALAQVAKLAPQGSSKRCRAKSVKFALHPSVELLTRELHMLRESFEDIVHHDGNLEFSFYSESL